MFKKLKESVYCKAALALLVSGCLLIIFNSWISRARIGASFAAINEVLTPFYIGIILTFLLCPIYNAIVKAVYTKKSSLTIAKVIASVASFLIVVGFVALMVYLIVPQLISSCVDLVDTMPERLATLSDWLSVHFARFPSLAKEVDAIADQGTVRLINYIKAHVLSNDAASIIGQVSTGVVSAVNTVVDMIIGILIMVYLLNYKEKIFAICRKLVNANCKEKAQAGIVEFVGVLNETFIGFIVGRVIDSAIIGLLTYVVLLIFGISFAPMISVIVGVTNVIPFFGPFLGAIPSVLLLLLESPREALIFIIIILVIQELDGNVIGPKCVGNAIGIDSFWVLVAVLIGGGLFGIMGMVFGVPVFAVIYRYTEKLTVHKLAKQEKPIRTEDYMNFEKYGLEAGELPPEKDKSKKKKRRNVKKADKNCNSDSEKEEK